MSVFTVYKARLVYDVFKVEAETPKDAGKLVSDGKIREYEEGISCEHDYFYDDKDSIVIVEPNTNDGAGYWKTVARFDDGEL